jgi:DnaJ-domain-containing protein 1
MGLTEWHAAVWIGRLFMLDADYGEHWFDNWDEREALAARAEALGIDPSDLMILSPDRMASGDDGPCHPPELRKRFWTDVLKSLELSYDLLFGVAREMNAHVKEVLPSEYIEDLEERIRQIQAAIEEADAAEQG